MNGLGVLGIRPGSPAIGPQLNELEPVAREAALTLSGEASIGAGGRYRPHPRMPSMDHLEYVNKFASAALLVLGLFLLVGYAAKSPGGAFSILVRGAKHHAGVK